MKDIASFNNGITYRGRSTITGQFLMILHGQPTRDAFQFHFTIWKFAKTPLVTLILSNTSDHQETIHHTSGRPETIHHTSNRQRTIHHILGLPKTALHNKVRPGANTQITNQHITNNITTHTCNNTHTLKTHTSGSLTSHVFIGTKSRQVEGCMYTPLRGGCVCVGVCVGV
jgi:hypothetical protein